jgi:hypothetical protein
MRVVMVEPHHLIDVQGFELRTFQCVGCGDVEKRPFFDSERTQRPPGLVPEAAPASAKLEASGPSEAPKAPEAQKAPEPPEASQASDASHASDESDASETPGGPVLGSTMKAILDSLVRLRGTKQSEH